MKWSLALLIAACAGGIASTRLTAGEFQSRPVEVGAHVPLEVGDDDRGSAEIASGGAFTTTLSQRRLRVVHLRVTVRNADADVIVVPFDQLAIEGIGDERLRPTAVFGERDDTATGVVVPPGAVRSADVVFALPGAIAPEDVGGFQFFWGVDLPGDVVRKATVFTPTELPKHGVARAFRPLAQ